MVRTELEKAMEYLYTAIDSIDMAFDSNYGVEDRFGYNAVNESIKYAKGRFNKLKKILESKNYVS